VKPKNTTSFKKKKKDKEKGNCFTCGKTRHFARDCLDAKWKPNQKKSVNMVEAEGGTSGYGNSLHTVLSVLIHLIGGLIQEPIYMYVLINPFFFLSSRAGCLLVDGKWSTCFCSWCWYGRSEAYLGKDRAAEECATCPLNKEELD
jgi:hypothetical protein